MLRHFKHVDFPPLLKNFDLFHIFFVHSLDGHLLTRLFVRGQLNQPELALAEVVFNLIKIKQVRVTHHFLQGFDPLCLQTLIAEIEDTALIRRKHYLHGEQFAVLRFREF